MKYSKIFSEKIGCNNPEDVFDYFMKTLKETIKGWDFFVGWDKVRTRVSDVHVSLHILNSLIGKENIREEFKKLIYKYPEIVSIIPLLLAIRESNIKVLDSNSKSIFNFREFCFNINVAEPFSSEQVEHFADFAEKTQILDLFSKNRITNIVDYVTGVEVGLDSNARKNRTGVAMEKILGIIISDICSKKGYRYISQATPKKIRSELNFEVFVDKSERSFDFAIDAHDKLYLIETNYYASNGLKLKAVAGEFSSMFEYIKKVTPQHGFIWVTDGAGWEPNKRPLKEAFDRIDYIMNLEMIDKGLLEGILGNEE